MRWSQLLLIDRQGVLAQRLRLLVLALPLIEFRQVIEARRRMRMRSEFDLLQPP
jgi:hypothetical protein